jgi:hypothetical protein
MKLVNIIQHRFYILDMSWGLHHPRGPRVTKGRWEEANGMRRGGGGREAKTRSPPHSP